MVLLFFVCLVVCFLQNKLPIMSDGWMDGSFGGREVGGRKGTHSSGAILEYMLTCGSPGEGRAMRGWVGRLVGG